MTGTLVIDAIGCSCGACILLAEVAPGFDFLQYGALGLLALLLLLSHRRDTKRDEALGANTKALTDMTLSIRELALSAERVGEKRADLAKELASGIKQEIKDTSREMHEQLREHLRDDREQQGRKRR